MSYPIIHGIISAGNMYSGGDDDGEFEGGSGKTYLEHVKWYQRKHPKLTWKECMVMASKSWQKLKGKKGKGKGKKGGLLSSLGSGDIQMPHITAMVRPSPSQVLSHIKSAVAMRPEDHTYAESVGAPALMQEAEGGLGTAVGAAKARAAKAAKRAARLGLPAEVTDRTVAVIKREVKEEVKKEVKRDGSRKETLMSDEALERKMRKTHKTVDEKIEKLKKASKAQDLYIRKLGEHIVKLTHSFNSLKKSVNEHRIGSGLPALKAGAFGGVKKGALADLLSGLSLKIE